MRLRVNHITRYHYPVPVTDSQNEVRLKPVTDEDQSCLEFTLKTTPMAKQFEFSLPTGIVQHFGVSAAHKELTVSAESFVETRCSDPFQGLPLETNLRDFYRDPPLRQDFAEYLSVTKRVRTYPEIASIATLVESVTQGGTIEFLQALNRHLYRLIAYAPGKTDVDTPLLEVLEKKAGVCQDYSHLMLAVCRHLGIPARYVSGYLYTGNELSPLESAAKESDEIAAVQEALRRGFVSGDAMHAWVECLLPDLKWHGFDPTNNVLTNDRYVKVHFGRDYDEVPPIKGVFRGATSQTLEVAVHVTLS